MTYADEVKLLEDNIGTINKKAKTLVDTSKEVGPEENVEKTKYVFVSVSSPEHRLSRDIQIANRTFEHVSQLAYVGTRVINQNFILEEIKRRLNYGVACYHSVQDIVSSRLLSINVKIRIY
jgi:hypothetical protein